MKRFLTLLSSLFITLSLTACMETTNPIAEIETSMGTITVEVYRNEVPQLAKNFLTLAEEGKYDDVIFHRVIDGFMIQTGDFENNNGTGGHSYLGKGTELKGEFDEKISKNLRGTLSMANRGPDTNGSQFFINLIDNNFLDHDVAPFTSQHPVFANVVSGMDVVDKLAKVETQPGDRPVEDVMIKSVTIKEVE
ncbi:MAG: peptidylprolyl isomerase [Candidatus Gracilibacteria bacterium]|nr:peptidylprolyl isomerase [Candidatus Gracilibacteria bacterium]